MNRLEKYAKEKYKENAGSVKDDMSPKELVGMVKMQDALHRIIYRRLDRYLFEREA